MTPLQILKLKPGFETLGALIDFLASDPPYATFRAGDLVAAITYQPLLGHHVAGMENKRLIAYCGWLTTSTERAEATGSRQIGADSTASRHAAALTIVKVRQQAHLLPMIRACRVQNKGKRVFFKRDYSAPDKQSRKAAVTNTG